jgi:Uma2 family endonuclease
MTPPPDYTHNYAVSRLNRLLSEYLIKSDDKGRLFVPRTPIWTSANTYLEPDLFYVSAETEEQLDPKHFTSADLVIEVISPGSAIYDRNTKADTYAALGVKELWLVDEAFEMIEVRHPTPSGSGVGKVYSKDDKLRSLVLSDLELDIRRVFY